MNIAPEFCTTVRWQWKWKEDVYNKNYSEFSKQRKLKELGVPFKVNISIILGSNNTLKSTHVGFEEREPKNGFETPNQYSGRQPYLKFDTFDSLLWI